MRCPHDSARCSCWEHADGLLAFTPRDGAYEAFLAPLQPTRLVVLTTDTNAALSVEHNCQGTMTCPCRRCSTDRGQRRPAEVRQPWETRAA